MKKLLFLLLFIPLITFGQSKSVLNGFKYAVIEKDSYLLKNKLIEIGIQAFNINEKLPEDLITNNCLATYISFNSYRGGSGSIPAYFTDIVFKDCSNSTIFIATERHQTNYNGSLSKSIKRLDKKISYSFNPSLIITSGNNSLKNTSSDENSIDLSSELSIREYFDENGTELIEGVWEILTREDSYRLAIIKSGFKFNATVIESSTSGGASGFNPGELKATLETTVSDEVVTINWIQLGKSKKKTVGVVKNNNTIEFTVNDLPFLAPVPYLLYKVYPKIGKLKKSKTSEWAGNGSGIIISKSGHIVTNYHVIKDTDKIEVEFILNEEVQKFNAEIVTVDKLNDLAIIKIFDMNFDGLDNIGYNFKTESSEVGTKVYAYGYPMALTAMGKEIKITDGIISSKSGFDGNVTTYQITAPIQAGNSGGPLFDQNGNFIGINSSGLGKDVADNVGYTIKSSYVLNLLDVLTKSIDLPSNNNLESLPLTEQIKEISKYVVLIKVK